MISKLTRGLVASALFVGAQSFGQVLVNSAGASFPYPIYSRWFEDYHRSHPGALINYQPVGSAAGMRQLQAGVLDFGASDMPLPEAEIARFQQGVLHFPTVVGAVVPVYNLPAGPRELNFSPESLSGILLGKITNWNSPELLRDNPGARLPNSTIIVVHRSDGSGTTYILSDFLSKTSPAWKTSVGVGAALRWPAGIGARGNEGVAGIVQQTPYSIGYVELVYAEQNRMRVGRVRNSAGKFIKANISSIKSAAATVAGTMPADFRVSITNAPGQDAYPIASYTWLLTPARIADEGKRRIVIDFLRWMLNQGQRSAEPLGYAPLPKQVAEKALAAVAAIR